MCRFSRLVQVLGVLVVVVTISTSFGGIGNAGEFVTPEGVTLLTGDEIRSTLIGNSLRGRSWTEYYAPNGRIGGKYKARYYKGSWEINGSRLCVDYDGTEYDGCVTISISGDSVTWYRPNGKQRWNATLLPGNDGNL